MLGVVRYPYLPTDVDRVMQQVGIEMGRGETFNTAPVGVYFGSPGVEADDPYFGGVGPRRTGCISVGKCNIGFGRPGVAKRLRGVATPLREKRQAQAPRTTLSLPPWEQHSGQLLSCR